MLNFSLQTFAQTYILVLIKNPLNHKIDKIDAFDISIGHNFKSSRK
jgi:hypothetical protein